MQGNVIKLADLYKDIDLMKDVDSLQYILNQPPKAEWVKVHPYIKNWKYLPIDKVEFLLRRIFKRYKIEVLREGTAFNGVYVVARIHYMNPITTEWDYHDGIGAVQLQTSKGTSPADLANINSGAISMAFPTAETFAIKDAADKFGRIFGADLNRKDIALNVLDVSVIQKADKKKATLDAAYDRIKSKNSHKTINDGKIDF